MTTSLIVFRSVTYAQRGSRVLAQNGIGSNMIRAQAVLGGGSCSYALKVSTQSLQQAAAILQHSKIPYTALYAPDRFGHYTPIG